MQITHFGIKIKDKSSNYINKESFISSKPEGMVGWNESHYEAQRQKASLNYDLNMRFFNTLNHNEFDEYTKKLYKKFGLKECIDLKSLDNVSGLYILILDKHKQLYIGQSNNIKKRIQQHWNRNMSLERLIFGTIIDSIISIDCFGALDTSRIYYIETTNSNLLYNLEEKVVSFTDIKYLLNRTAGGIGSPSSYTLDKKDALISIVANKTKRNYVNLITKDEIHKLQQIISEDEFNTWYLSKYPELSNIN